MVGVCELLLFSQEANGWEGKSQRFETETQEVLNTYRKGGKEAEI